MANSPSALFSVAKLNGCRILDLTLQSADAEDVSLSRLAGLRVVHAYPRTSPPDESAVAGWSNIPSVTGCTPQFSGFRDHFGDLWRVGVTNVIGLST
jgi:peroxiredoxin